MKLIRNRDALESLPLKLIIIAVVASLSVVPAAEALENMKTREFLRRAELQLEKIRTTAHIVSVEGPGSARLVDLDFSSKSRLSFGSLTIGDAESGANMSAIVLELNNGVRLVRFLDDPPIWLKGPRDSALVVDAPIFRLRISLVIVNSTSCVVAEAQPWIS